MERFIGTDAVSIELFFNVFHIRNWDISHSLGSTFIPLCRRSLPPGIGITVWQSMSFWKRWRWPHKNILRCMKRWTTIANADSMRLALCSGVSCFGTHLAHNFLNNRCSVTICTTRGGKSAGNDCWHSWRWFSIDATLCAFKNFITDRSSQSAGVGIRNSNFNRCAATMLLWELGKSR